MRTLLPAGLVAMLLAAPLGAQSPDALAGDWTFEQETPRGTVVHTVTFALEDAGWVGTMATEWCSFDLDDVAFDQGRLTFSFPAGPPPRRGECPGMGAPPRDGDRPASERTFEGVLEGGRIDGEMKGPRGSRPVVLVRSGT